MKIFSTLFTFLMAGVAFGQPVNWKKLRQLQPDKILLDPTNPPTQALLLGSFHFAYPNLDGHKTDSSKMMDVLSPQRQREIRQLADVIASFKPTRIYIESLSPRYIDSLYNAYLRGEHKLRRNEIDQLGFRLAKELGHTKVYTVDASNFISENYNKYAFIDSMRKSAEPVNAERDGLMDKRYKLMYDASDSIELQNTMLESFLLMAEPATLRRMHGHYLASGFNTKNNSGPDGLAMWWYSRNLRIFNNILKTNPGPTDRIVVIFGNGHMPILRHCFEASPEFEVVELKDLTLKMQTAGKIK
ncbi:DUF5694 domain-containing protein [Paraflavitalea sp. CAU 1676]|uniref:DUF5694 domain-containing protein n=1 Tax=Paraflavitalea sp. CAU 1676 TaxID=3032598 RepID=UPI0023DBDEEB|nr:DUF5694 domain-containing protein [Paraflavitalea sp. CAU 1676]MDF2190706.1 DUF5694 domain-containing protein [Paraflavitalea sp. CAU 1676]